MARLSIPRGHQRRTLLRAGLALLLTKLSRARAAEGPPPPFRLVVHPSFPERAVERYFLADAFLKKTTRWPNGELIRPADLKATSPVRKVFSERVLKRSVGAVRSYWQQRIFSGRDVPPPELDGDAEVIAFVAKHPGGVGYVSGAATLTGVKELSIAGGS